MTPAEQRYEVSQIFAEAKHKKVPLQHACVSVAVWFEKNAIKPPISIAAWLSEVPREWWRAKPCKMFTDAAPWGDKLYHYTNIDVLRSIQTHGLLSAQLVESNLGISLKGSHKASDLVWLTYSNLPADPERIPAWLWHSKMKLMRGEPARVVIDAKIIGNNLIYSPGGWENAVPHRIMPAMWRQVEVIGNNGEWISLSSPDRQ